MRETKKRRVDTSVVAAASSADYESYHCAATAGEGEKRGTLVALLDKDQIGSTALKNEIKKINALDRMKEQ